MTKEQFNILFVEDDDLFAEMCSDYFGSNPLLSFQRVTSGEEAIREVTSETNLVVLDYQLSASNMLVMNGLQTLNALKKKFPDLPVIVLSAFTSLIVVSGGLLFSVIGSWKLFK